MAALTRLRMAFTSSVMQAAGLMGGELSPRIEEIVGQLGAWFKEGGVIRLKDFLVNNMFPAVMSFVGRMIRVGKMALRLANRLEWLTGSEVQGKQKILKTFTQGGPGVGLASVRAMAKKKNLEGWFNDLTKNNPGLYAELRGDYMKGGLEERERGKSPVPEEY